MKYALRAALMVSSWQWFKNRIRMPQQLRSSGQKLTRTLFATDGAMLARYVGLQSGPAMWVRCMWVAACSKNRNSLPLFFTSHLIFCLIYIYYSHY